MGTHLFGSPCKWLGLHAFFNLDFRILLIIWISLKYNFVLRFSQKIFNSSSCMHLYCKQASTNSNELWKKLTARKLKLSVFSCRRNQELCTAFTNFLRKYNLKIHSAASLRKCNHINWSPLTSLKASFLTGIAQHQAIVVPVVTHWLQITN